MDLVTYLGFPNTCEEAFNRYAEVLGGTIIAMVKGRDMPGTTPEAADKVMHARLAVGDRLLMGGDLPTPDSGTPRGFMTTVMIDDVVEAERIFHALAEGGNVIMPIGETGWARRFGMAHDRFGIPWMVNCERPMGREETEGEPFVITRSFDVPKDKLWRAFTEAEDLAGWWGPKSHRVVGANMDLRPGGTFHYGLQGEDGATMWGRKRYREIVPGERIVWVNSFSTPTGGMSRHPMAPTWPAELLTHADFAEDGPDRSAVTITWRPMYPTDVERTTFDAGHDSMRGGWGGSFDRLADRFAGR